MPDLKTLHLIVSALGLLVIPLVGMLWKAQHALKTNHLDHLETQLTMIVGGMTRLETKLDTHLQWHSEQHGH